MKGPMPPPLSRSEVLEQTVYESARATVVVDASVKGKPVFSGLHGVVYLRNPDQLRIRLYRFGVPALDLLYRDGLIQGSPTDNRTPLRRWIPSFLRAIFWWDVSGSSDFHITDTAYAFTRPNQRVWIDRRSLLPVRQEIEEAGHQIVVLYDQPRHFDENRSFPSKIRIQASSSTLNVTIKNLTVGIPLEPDFFKPPA